MDISHHLGRLKLTLVPILLILSLTSVSWAATYYVDATGGNDSNSGLSESTPWKTIAKVNASKFNPADQILFKRGEVWRDQLTPQSSGTSGAPIIFGAYGTGDKPKISGADLKTVWTQAGKPFVWKTALPIHPRVVVCDGTYGVQVSSIDGLNAEYKWFYNPNEKELLLYAPTDPSTRYANPGVEVGARPYACLLDGKNYLRFDNLEFHISMRYGVFLYNNVRGHSFNECDFFGAFSFNIVSSALTSQTDITIANCRSSYAGAIGYVVGSITERWRITNCTSDHDGIVETQFDDGSQENLWGAGIKIVDGGNRSVVNRDHIIEYCTITNAGRRADGSPVHPTAKGHGIWVDLVVSGSGHENHIRYNKLYANNLSGLFCEKSENQKWYYNISYNNGQHGIIVGADDGSYPLAHNEFYNNTCYGNSGSGIYCAGGYLRSGYSVGYNTFKNNISVGNKTKQLTAIRGGENSGTLGHNNVYEYNCFGPETTNFIEWGAGVYKSTYNEWEQSYGKTTSSIHADPLFINTANGNFCLTPNSPCIDKGTNVSLGQDYFGTSIPVGLRVDVGASEYINTLLPPRNPHMIQ